MTLHRRRLIVLGVFFASVLALIVSMGVFDVIVIRFWGLDASISRSMRDLHPVLVFVWGNFTGGVIWGLAAHFWWSNPGDKK